MLCSAVPIASRRKWIPIWSGLFQRPSGDCSKLARNTVGRLAGHRKLALALEPLDGGLGLGINDPGRLDLAIAVFRQCPLQCDYPTRPPRPLDRSVVAQRH